MKAFKKARLILGALGLIMIMSQASYAQALNSNVATVTLNATMAESLTVSASPGIVNFVLPSTGSVLGSSTVSITTTWVLTKPVAGVGGRTSVKLYAGFTSATALTDGNGDNIPTANVGGQVNGAGPYNAFTGAGGTTAVNGNAITVFTQAIGGAGTFNSTRTDTVGLQITTTGLTLPAATYTGTLTIQAQAT